MLVEALKRLKALEARVLPNMWGGCDIWGIFSYIFKCVCLLMHARRATDAWRQETRTVAYVIMT